MPRTARSRPISLPAAAVFAVALAALLIIALFPIFPNRNEIRVGDTASRTVRSPRTMTFESAFLTEQRKQAAADAVPPSVVYDPRTRTEKLSEYDGLATQVTQIRALPDDARKRDALAELQLSARSIEKAIALTPERWATVADEGRRVLADTLAVSLDDPAAAAAKDGIDAIISSAFIADEALLTAELVRPLITTTLTIDIERTEQAREAARADRGPEVVNVERNDVILPADSRVDEVAIEKLRAAGLLSRSVEWRNTVAVAIIAAIAAIAVAGYLIVLQPRGITSQRHLIVLAIVTMVPLLACKMFLPAVLPDNERQFVAFVIPVAAAPLLIAALLDSEVAVVVSAITGMLIAFVSAILPDVSLVASVESLDTFRLLLVYGLGPIAGVYIVHRADRLNRYLTAGVAVALVSYALLLATWFIDTDRQTADLGWMALTTGVSGVGSGVLAAGAFVTAGVLFGVTTRVQLMSYRSLMRRCSAACKTRRPARFITASL